MASTKPIDDRLIGRRIEAIRKERRISTEELSTRSGVELHELKAIEAGTKPIHAATLWHFARILDVPITSFYDEGGTGHFLHTTFRIRDNEIRQQLLDLAEAIELYC